ncbi:BRCT domain-containing protein [Pectobacterium aroidearum]|uniref:BRCT domain-containing protein n=1 Tax=Pectobacterium aroidearum TaxID=1201031 RepID=UPI003158849D
MNFIYINAKKIVGAYSLINITQQDDYIQGICIRSNQLKTFRKDRIIQEFSSYDEAEKGLLSISLPDCEHLITKPSRKKSTWEICFTGFKSDDKKRLTAIAVENDLTVRSSVTEKLNILCCGYNAGPKKLEAARMKGILILNEDEFANLLETGELPDF